MRIRKLKDGNRQREIANRQMKLAKEDIYSLKKWKFNREEIYDRK